jgi:DNA-directed RNA polymerase subunit RPC12/RpoP
MEGTIEKINVYALDKAMGSAFVQFACALPFPSDTGICHPGDRDVQLAVASCDDTGTAGWKAEAKAAAGYVLTVQDLDVISGQRLRSVYSALAGIKVASPEIIALYRERGQEEYKVSCLKCGQKLWMRDCDVGRWGRCPRCESKFVILSQEAHARARLGLPEETPVMTVRGGDRDSFAVFLRRWEGSREHGGQDVFQESAKTQPKTIRLQRPA